MGRRQNISAADKRSTACILNGFIFRRYKGDFQNFSDIGISNFVIYIT